MGFNFRHFDQKTNTLPPDYKTNNENFLNPIHMSCRCHDTALLNQIQSIVFRQKQCNVSGSAR